MRKLLIEDGGRPLRNDDLDALGDGLLALEALCLALGGGDEFVLTGAEQVGADVSSGLVFMNGKVKRFDGKTNTTLGSAGADLITNLTDATVDTRTYEDASSHDSILIEKAELR